MSSVKGAEIMKMRIPKELKIKLKSTLMILPKKKSFKSIKNNSLG